MNNDRKLSYDEFNYAINKIDNWYEDNKRNLNVFTVPYNTNLIFINLILKVINNGGKVLYVYGTRKSTKELFDKLSEIIKCSYSELKDLCLTFISYKKITNIKYKYDLAIIDDISAYCSMKNENIEDINYLLNNIAKKNIIYSIENKFNFGNQLKLSSIYKISPFIEPRIINTRVNLIDGMPYVLYDYFKWFEKNKRKVIVYVPDKEKIKLLDIYYTSKLDMKNSKFVFDYSINFEFQENVLNDKNKAIFIVTNNIEKSLEKIEIQDAIVLFADDKYYNYKKLIFLCANMKNHMNEKSEVLFISKDISYDMDKAKNMVREFNKTLWEKKLINL